MSQLIKALQAAFPEKIEPSENSSYPAVKVAPADLVAVMQYLRDEQHLNFLSMLCSADYPEENAFEVNYILHSLYEAEEPDEGEAPVVVPKLKKIQVKVRVPRNNPEVPTVTGVYKGADWQEREEFDLMGIQFTGHPNLVRVLLPDDFKGHPLRKDYKGVKL